MKFAEARRRAGTVLLGVDGNRELPLGIIEDTETGDGVCTFDFNAKAKDAPLEMLAQAALLVHCYNKFPDALNALRSAEKLIVDILDNHPAVFPSKGLKVNLTPEQALWRKKIRSCRQDLKKAIADAEEVEVDG